MGTADMDVDGSDIAGVAELVEQTDAKEMSPASAGRTFGAAILNNIHPVVAAIEEKIVVAGGAGEEGDLLVAADADFG